MRIQCVFERLIAGAMRIQCLFERLTADAMRIQCVFERMTAGAMRMQCHGYKRNAQPVCAFPPWHFFFKLGVAIDRIWAQNLHCARAC